jgi:capsular polysaccharide biosynthesis protein
MERAKLALEASRAQASERMAIIDPPYKPTHPSKGGRTNVAIAGFAAAWLLAIAYALVRVTLDDTLVDADDVAALGIVPVLGVVPRIKPKEPRHDAA